LLSASVPLTIRDWNPSPAFGTAISLITLQLDNEHVPIPGEKEMVTSL
jgi:hypothetical protein